MVYLKAGIKMEIKKRILLKGKMNGISTLYYENSQIKRIENYKNDEFIDGKCFDENGTEIAFFPTIKPEGGIKEFYKYVGENFKSLIVLKDK
jgi:protein TonB